MAEQNGTPAAPRNPDSIITTQRNGQTIVAELFFNHSSTETFRDKLLKVILPTVCISPRLTVKSRKKRKSCDNSRPDEPFPVRAVFIVKNAVFPKSRAGENTRKMPLLRNRGAERRVYETGLTKQEKTTDIWFDEKDPLIHIRTHNTALKKRLLAYSRRYPAICQQTDADPETGCMEFDIEKGRFSFRLTAPYSEERRAVCQREQRRRQAEIELKCS